MLVFQGESRLIKSHIVILIVTKVIVIVVVIVIVNSNQTIIVGKETNYIGRVVYLCKRCLAVNLVRRLEV